MPNKPDKFGIKLRMAVDAETKYLYISFPYQWKHESRNTSVNLPAYVVTKLRCNQFSNVAIMSLVTIFSQVFMLLSVWQNKNVVLLAQSDRIVENYHKAAKRKQQQHETFLFTSTQTAVVTLTPYLCKKRKSLVIMSTLHPDVEISSHNNPKKKPETVLFYNKTKAVVNVID